MQVRVPHALVAVAQAASPGCVGQTASAGGAPPALAAEERPAPRPADAQADADYYVERSRVLLDPSLDEIAGTDFRRFRRGRLYARGAEATLKEVNLERDLTSAAGRGDVSAISEAATALVLTEPTAMNAHTWRARSLEREGRPKEAERHRAMALALLQSVTGDGESVDTAWRVFDAREERDILQELGYWPSTQKLLASGERWIHLVEAREVASGTSRKFHFDITELHHERLRSARAASPGTDLEGRPVQAPPSPKRSTLSWSTLVGAGPGGRDACGAEEPGLAPVARRLAQLGSCTALPQLDGTRFMFLWLTFHPEGSPRFQLIVTTPALQHEVSECVRAGLARMSLPAEHQGFDALLVPIVLSPGEPPRLSSDPEVAGAEATGVLDRSGDVAWTRAVGRHSAFFSGCNNLAANRNQTLSGSIDLALEVDGQGSVGSVKLLSSTIDDCQVTQCFAHAVQGMHLPGVSTEPRLRRLRFSASGSSAILEPEL